MAKSIPTYMRVLIVSTLALALFFGGISTGGTTLPVVGRDTAAADSGHFEPRQVGSRHWIDLYRYEKLISFSQANFINCWGQPAGRFVNMDSRPSPDKQIGSAWWRCYGW